MKNSIKYLVILMTGMCLFGFSGCDNESSSSTEPGKNMAFTPDTQNAPDNSISLRFVNFSGDDIILEVYAKKVTDVYGAAFAVQFDPEIFQYIAATEGPFFSSSTGQSTFMAAGGTGSITIGNSLLGSEVQPVSGSGSICSIVFRGVNNGQSRLEFVEQQLFNSSGQKISGVQWFGGLGIVND